MHTTTIVASSGPRPLARFARRICARWRVALLTLGFAAAWPTSSIGRIQTSGTGAPQITQHPADRAITVGATATFTVNATGAVPAHVASDATFHAATTSRALTVAPAAIGNLLIVGFDSADPTANPGISDTGGHTWKICNVKFVDSPHHQTLISWYAIAKTTSSITITAVSNVPSHWISITLDQFSGVNTSNPLDQHVESLPAGSASNPAIGASMTPSVDNELVWAFAAGMISGTGKIDGVAASPGGDSGGDDRSEYRILTGRSGVPMTASFTTYSPYKYNILSATFRPAALAYQWQKNNVDIPGATSSSYTTPTAVLGDNNSTYRCRVTNGAGTATSNAATLTVTIVAAPGPPSNVRIIR